MGASLQVALGSVLDDSTVRTVNNLGLGTVPKAIIFWGNTLTADGAAVHNSMFIGMASSPSNQGCIAMNGQDGVDPTNEDRQKFNTSAVAVDYGDGNDWTMAVTDMSVVDQFTITPGAGSPSSVVNWLALGGADIQAKAVWNLAPTTLGLESLSGVGFSPDAAIYLLNNLLQASTRGTGAAQFGVGVADRAGHQRQMSLASLDNTDPLVEEIWSTLGSASCISALNPTTGAKVLEAVFSSFDADGEMKNWTTVSGFAAEYLTLYLKGVQLVVGSFLKGISTGLLTVTGVGAPGKAAMFFGRKAPASAFSANLGAAISPSAQSCIWTGEA